jgi:hypothetical protein
LQSDAHIHDVEIEADRDGIDLVGCRHVLAERIHVHRGGDDAIALKSDWSLGARLDTTNITLRDSRLASGESSVGCQCIQIGSETSGNFDALTFRNVTCDAAGKAGIGFTTMDGGNISNVVADDIRMAHVTEPVHFYVGARAWQRRPPPWLPGSISNITLLNIQAVNVSGRPPSLPIYVNFSSTIDGQGVSQNVSVVHPISRVTMRNVSIIYRGGGIAGDAVQYATPFHDPNNGGPRNLGVRPAWGLFLRNLRDSTLDDVRLAFEEGDDRPAIVLDQCRRVSLGGLRAARGPRSSYDVGVRNSTMIKVTGSGPAGEPLRVCRYPDCPMKDASMEPQLYVSPGARTTS